MKPRVIKISLIILAAFLIIPTAVLAEELTPTEPLMPGRVEGTGTYFEIKDSEYLNVSLKSSEEITVLLESIPKTISIYIEASTSTDSTALTIGGLESNKTYYKFENSYKNEVVFVSDNDGKYGWAQDLVRPHHVWFQPENNGTVLLPEDCNTYGIWDELTSTCALTRDLTESVVINANDIVLDCRGHSIKGGSDYYGIYLNGRNNVRVQNCAVSGFNYAISLNYSSNNTIANNTVSRNTFGIILMFSPNNNLSGNTATLNEFYGILVQYSGGNALINNIANFNNYHGITLHTISNNNTLSGNIVNANINYGLDIYHSTGNTLKDNAMSGSRYNFNLVGSSDEDFSNNIDTSNRVEGKPIYYVRNAVGQIYDGSTNAGTFYCISCYGVTIKDLSLEKNGVGILFWKTENSKIENTAIANNLHGIIFYYSNNNTLINNTVSSNAYSGIYLQNSSGNTLSDNIANSNIYDGIQLTYLSNANIASGNTINSNNGRGILINSSDNNRIYHNNFIQNYVQAEILTASGNLFDNSYPSGGNYWSDYRWIDEKSGSNQDQPGPDKIGDTPYAFPGGEDRYPFMEESGWVAPPIPAYNVAVILAEPANVPRESAPITTQPCKLFPEKTYPDGHNKEYFQDLAYCVTDYHKENSFGRVNLNFTIYDNDGKWFEIPENENFITKTIEVATSTGIDLSEQDIIIIVEAGRGGGPYSGGSGTAYQIVEIDQSTGNVINFSKILIGERHPLGAWIHEIGHFAGSFITPDNTATPDLYDMGNVGKWDVMALGAWNGGSFDILFVLGDGTNPSYMSSFTKEFLQWLNYDIHPKSAYGEYWINSLETSGLGDNVFRYNLSYDTNEESQRYYILEARNKNLKTWDSSLLKDKTLVLYYIDTKGWPKYDYNLEGRKENIENWIINIPVNEVRYIGMPIEDGILTPLDDTYRDLDNLVKFTTGGERYDNGKYEIKTKIEEMTFDSFSDKFWGVILKPKSTLKEKIKGDIIFRNPLGPVGTDKDNQTESITSPLVSGAKEYFRDLARGIFWYLLHPLIFLNFFLILFNKKVRKIKENRKPLRIFKKFIFTVIIFIVSAGPFFYIGMAMTEFLWLLIPFIPFLIWLNVKEFKTGDRLIRIFLGTLWIIGIIFLIGIISLWFYSYTRPSQSEGGVRIELKNFQQKSPISKLITFPDLDLHLYCEDGGHIGMNYDTNQYEIKIEDAIVSGENQNAPEWIFIPPDITGCHFVVSSYDNQKFLEENPEIAQEIEDVTDNYDIYARYIDPTTAIFTSTAISEDIEPAKELEQPISGTVDIAVLPAIPWKVPKALKETSIIKLEKAKTGDKKIDKEIDKIINHIKNSLENKKGSLWLDDWHLIPEVSNIKAFDEQRAAVKRMLIDLGECKEKSRIEFPAEIKQVFGEVIDNLIRADKLLARTIIEDAKITDVKNPKFEKIVKHLISKEEDEYEGGLEELERAVCEKHLFGGYSQERAITRFSKSWLFGQLAIKTAESGFGR